MPRRRQNPSHFEIAIEIEPYLIKYASAGNDGNFLWVNADKEQIWSFVSGQLKIAPPSWKPKKISKKSGFFFNRDHTLLKIDVYTQFCTPDLLELLK